MKRPDFSKIAEDKREAKMTEYIEFLESEKIRLESENETLKKSSDDQNLAILEMTKELNLQKLAGGKHVDIVEIGGENYKFNFKQKCKLKVITNEKGEEVWKNKNLDGSLSIEEIKGDKKLQKLLLNMGFGGWEKLEPSK